LIDDTTVAIYITGGVWTNAPPSNQPGEMLWVWGHIWLAQ